MSYLAIPGYPVLRGEEAIEALNDFIDELQGQKGEELTGGQTRALIKLAKGLISSVEAQEPALRAIRETRKKIHREKLAIQELQNEIDAKRRVVEQLELREIQAHNYQ